MIISKVSFTRKFNLGNFESLDLSIEAQLGEKDNPLEVWTILKDNAEMWFIDYKKKLTGQVEEKPSVASPTPLSQKPSATPPTAMPTLNMPEAISHLTEQHFENGYYYINPKHFLPPVDFQIVNDWIKQQHGEYVKATSNIPGHWRVKN